jgi:hypothetical protein
MQIQTDELVAICRAFAKTAITSQPTCVSGQIGASQELEWSETLCAGAAVDYETAEKACADLNDADAFGRGEGWRLPTRMELETILDLTRHDPAIDTTRFPDTKSAAYWTSTPCAWAPSCAWIVLFHLGYASSLPRSYRACVRAVRSVSAGQ